MYKVLNAVLAEYDEQIDQLTMITEISDVMCVCALEDAFALQKIL